MAWPPTTHQDAADEITSLRDGKGWAVTLGGRQRITEAARPGPLLWVVGRYFTAQMTGGASTTAPPGSELRLLPFYVPVPRTIDRVACNVSTASSTAGHVARLGVYNANAATGLPTTVLVDSGTVAVDTTGAKDVAVSATLHGLHWLGLTAQGGSFSAALVGTLAVITGAFSPGGAVISALAYSAVDPAAALPDRTGVTADYAFSAIPLTYVRAV